MICERCGRDKPESDFYLGRKRDGSACRRHPCKVCYSAKVLRQYRTWRSDQITRKVLAYVEMRIRWGFEPPSLEEIAGAVRVSVPTVLWHIAALERAGKIVRQPRKHRGLKLTA